MLRTYAKERNNVYREPCTVFIMGILVVVELVWSGKERETRSAESIHCLPKLRKRTESQPSGASCVGRHSFLGTMVRVTSPLLSA